MHDAPQQTPAELRLAPSKNLHEAHIHLSPNAGPPLSREEHKPQLTPVLYSTAQSAGTLAEAGASILPNVELLLLKKPLNEASHLQLGFTDKLHSELPLQGEHQASCLDETAYKQVKT